MREIINVKPTNDYELILTFDNNEQKIKDMKPYLEQGVFQKLKNLSFFKSVKIEYGTVSWKDSIDMCPDNLYMTSQSINPLKEKMTYKYNESNELLKEYKDSQNYNNVDEVIQMVNEDTESYKLNDKPNN